MPRKICVCCGLNLVLASSANPNVCRDCEGLMADESPAVLAREAASRLEALEPAAAAGLPATACDGGSPSALGDRSIVGSSMTAQ